MASSSFRFLRLVILMIAGSLVFLGDDRGVSAQCESSIPKLISECYQYVQIPGPEIQPSQGCCNVITSLDIPCICKHVTPEVEKLVSVEKVVYVARYCGLTLQPGMKCGSFVVPPSPPPAKKNKRDLS